MRDSRELVAGLTLQDLDVETLEQRLEMANAATPESWTCGTDCSGYTSCGTDTHQPLQPEGGSW